MGAHAASPINEKALRPLYSTQLFYYFYSDQTKIDFCIASFAVLSRIFRILYIAILEFYHIVCFYQGGSEEALIVNSNPLTQVSDVVFIRLNQHHCTEYTRSFIIFNVICQSANLWTETAHLVVSL